MSKRKHTGEKAYKCDRCDYASSNSGNLTVHKRTHTGEKPYKCNQCDYSSAQHGGLTAHKRTHTSEKPFECDKCDYTCLEKRQWIVHKRTHTGEKPYKCDHCNYACTATDRLIQHKRKHTGEKPYKCDQCDRACATSSHLIVHKRTHTGEKPFKCDQCAYATVTHYHLKDHKRTHTGEKPYKCEHCSKTFATSSNRTVHHKMHEIQKSYNFLCPMQDCGLQLAQEQGDLQCTIRCNTLLDLDYHIQRHHTEEGIARKFHSEQKLAEFFQSRDISFDRDWLNRVAFQTCKNIEGHKQSARPDFYLHAKSAELGCVFLVGNDEFAHRQTKCEFQRMFNIANALEQTSEFAGVPIVYVRFNPHFYHKDGKLFDMPLDKAHDLLLNTINSFTRVPHKGVNLVYVNYDTRDNKLCIFDESHDDDYCHLFQDTVVANIHTI